MLTYLWWLNANIAIPFDLKQEMISLIYHQATEKKAYLSFSPVHVNIWPQLNIYMMHKSKPATMLCCIM